MSPSLICPLSETADGSVAAQLEDDKDLVKDLKGSAVLGDLIVGTEAVTLDSRGKGAPAARVLPSPKEPTQAAIDRHNVLHLPFEFWCPICVASRRPNDQHRIQHDCSRQIPLLVGDF